MVSATKWYLLLIFLFAGSLTRRQGLLQKASHREARLSQEVWASHREAIPLTGQPGLSQGGWASHREAGPLSESRTSHREAVPLTGRLGLSKGGGAYNREACLSQGG